MKQVRKPGTYDVVCVLRLGLCLVGLVASFVICYNIKWAALKRKDEVKNSSKC